MTKKKVTTGIKKSKPETVAEKPEAVPVPVAPLRERTTLITTGMRSHVRHEDAATLDTREPPPNSADELWERWNRALEKAKRAGCVVPGAGSNGIASGYLRDQVAQLATPDNVWFMSNGLGLVRMTGEYPQYHLGKMESDIRKYPNLDPDAITEREWWNKLIGSNWGSSFYNVITEAVEKGHRVLVTIVSINYYVVLDDLARVVQYMTEDSNFEQRVVRQVRLVGQGLETAVPAPLLPCVMPFDAQSLTHVVPGSRTNSLRRMAFLLQHVTKDVVDAAGGSDPLKDAELLDAACASGETLTYNSFSDQRQSNRSSITDSVLLELIRDKFMQRVGANVPRIIRMLKHEGHNVPRARVEEAIRRARSAE